MTIEHRDLTGAELHEPKDIDVAAANKVYVSDGIGSGTWEKVSEDQMTSGVASAGQVAMADGSGGVMYESMAHGRISFNNVASPFSTSISTSYVKLVPTTTPGASPSFVTEGTNARLTYTGTRAQHFHIAFTISLNHNGASQDVYIKLYKSGVAIDSSEVVQTVSTTSKQSTAVHADLVLQPNDYIEAFIKVDTTSTVLVYGYYLFMMGMHEA